MSYYFLEFRFQGNAKIEIKNLIWHINKRFKIFPNKRSIPHITLIAPFYTNKETKLVYDFKNVCENHSLVNFSIDGYGTFEKSKVVYIKIYPSKEMLKFRAELLEKLKSYCTLNKTDLFSFLGLFKVKKNYTPHVTLAMKVNSHKFSQIKRYVRNLVEPKYKHNLLRVTLIKNQRIICEYDFLQKKLLNRREALSKGVWRKTISLMKNDN